MLIVPVVLFVMAAFPATVLAEGGHLNARIDLEFLGSNTETEDKETGETTETDFFRFEREYDIELQKEIYRYLSFRAGGLFELTDTDTFTDGDHSEIPERSGRVFAELNLENPLYTWGVAYRRIRSDFDRTSSQKTTDHREEVSVLSRWRPVGFPMFDMNYDYLHFWDEEDDRDSVLNRLTLQSRYNYEDFSYDYLYTLNDNVEKFDRPGALIQTHNGNIGYSTRFFNDRLSVSESLRLNYQTLQPKREGEIELLVNEPRASLFLQDDDSEDSWTPDDLTDALAGDSIIIASSTLPPVRASAGLRFEIATDVDAIHLLPEVGDGFAAPSVIAGISFIWDVYISDDGLSWNVHGPVTWEYDTLENRFTISFPIVETRYLKVVTTRESITDPDPVVIGSIQPYTTVPVDPGTELQDFDLAFSHGLQWKITDKVTASHDLFLRYQESQPSANERTIVTNSVSVYATLHPRVFASARVLRSDVSQSGREDTVNHAYSASVTANYFDTLRQTFVYSGNHNDDSRGTSYTNSLLLRTDADLYRGWSANLDLGFSSRESTLDVGTTTTFLRVGTDVRPHRTLNFAIDYRVALNTEAGASSTIDQTARFQGFWVPIRTLSFFAAIGLRHKESQRESLEVDQDYSASWSPFPDGALRFSVGASLSKDKMGNEIKSLSPQIDWRILRTTFLNLSFNIGTIESETQMSHVKSVRATLRTSY
jgi:hypothetical protein